MEKKTGRGVELDGRRGEQECRGVETKGKDVGIGGGGQKGGRELTGSSKYCFVILFNRNKS